MKLKYFITIIIALGLLINPLVSFGLSSPASVLQNASLVESSSVVSVVKVIQESTAAQPHIVYGSSASALAIAVCKAASAQTNVVQGTTGINLNEPANCFSLNLKTVSEQFNLSVRPLVIPAGQVRVVSPQETINPLNVSQNNHTQIPVTSTAIFVLLLLYAAIEFKTAIKRKINSQNNFVYRAGLLRLNILRC